MNTSGHFLMVITKTLHCWSGNAGDAGAKPLLGSVNTVHWQVRGAGAKPLLGSVNTVQCQVRGCGGEAPARLSKHCSVPG